MSIKVIGAGFPRTGTMTLKKALEILGYNKTYHFKDLVANPNKLHLWQDLEENGETNFEELFEGCQATTDFPAYPYYKILLKKYPDAKIILTKRNVDDWYKSTHSTIWKSGPQNIFTKTMLKIKMSFNPKLKQTFDCIKFMKSTYLAKQFDDQFDTPEYAKKVFKKHIQDVTEYVPEQQLLVYEVTQGWGPLCNFLSIDIPSEPFPHLNKKENFHQMVKRMIKDAAKT